MAISAVPASSSSWLDHISAFAPGAVGCTDNALQEPLEELVRGRRAPHLRHPGRDRGPQASAVKAKLARGRFAKLEEAGSGRQEYVHTTMRQHRTADHVRSTHSWIEA
jgi:hypothetical protein